MNIIRNAFLIALAAATPAFAQQAAQPPQQGGGPDAVFAAWDKNHDGSLSKEEFHAGWSTARTDLVAQRLLAEFQRQDVNKSTKLEADEFANLLLVKRLGQSAPAMSGFDANKDNGLDFNEYLEFIKVATRQLSAPAAPQAK
jgi:hypothetical protein